MDEDGRRGAVTVFVDGGRKEYIINLREMRTVVRNILLNILFKLTVSRFSVLDFCLLLLYDVFLLILF